MVVPSFEKISQRREDAKLYFSMLTIVAPHCGSLRKIQTNTLLEKLSVMQSLIITEL